MKTPKFQKLVQQKIEKGKASAQQRDLLDCENIGGLLDAYLQDQNLSKFNHLQGCRGEKPCSCERDEPIKLLDLIVLIDTSTSMEDYVVAISQYVQAGIKAALLTCPTDLRVKYMGVEGMWGPSVFHTNHLQYLKALHPTATFAADTNHVGLRQEQGANAIEDLSKYYDWRAGACRVIFYISDEELDSWDPHADFANENAVTAAAIAAATANHVTVFAHHLRIGNLDAPIIQNYHDLCVRTGGQCFFTAENATEAQYITYFTAAICKGCGPSCKEAIVPDLQPCITIAWGDSDCDCVETDDLEVMYITVCNCYNNITFKNLSIGYLMLMDATGRTVDLLPDETPSARILPIGPYCFGDIAPCIDGKPTCKSREFVLATRGAKSGKYQVRIGAICYDVCFHYDTERCMELTLCKD